ncbi:GntR family transcriptional regulator [Natronospirillum operosum]|nr:GntR family transcriptional regulator [Natronospirillum operosum]
MQRLERRLQALQAQNPRTPKYRLLRDALIELIVDGALAEGTRLPTEQAMAEALPLSLGTIQKALRELVQSGELVRHRRRGTFVAAGDHRHEISTPAFSFLRPDGDRVRMVFIRLLKRRRLTGRGAWTGVLGPCDDGYVQIVRQDRIDGAFDAYSNIILRGDIAAPLMTLPAEALEHESVLPLLQDRIPLAELQAENRLSRYRIPQSIGPHVGAAAGDTGLRLDIRYSLRSIAPDRPFAWMTMVMPPHDYQVVTRTRPDEA